MFGLFGADPTEEEKQTAVKTLLERLSDGTQPVSDQLKQVRAAEHQENVVFVRM